MATAPAGASSRVNLLLLALVLALSAWIQLTVVARTIVDSPLRADAGEYFSYAWNLDRHGVYSMAPSWRDPAAEVVPDAVRTPGYPLFLRLAGRPDPGEAWQHRVALLQALLGVASVLLTWLLARSLVGPRWALAAALLVATNPWLVMTSTYLLSETLFTFLLLASLLLTARAAAPGARARSALVAGLCWGACSLVRPTTQFLPLLFVAVAVLLPSLAQYRRQALFVLLGFAIAWAPWALRNRLSVPDDTSGYVLVASLAHGSYPGFMYEQRPESFGFPYRFDPGYQEKVRSLGSVLGHIAGEFRREPLRYTSWYLVGKPYYFLSLENVQSFDILIYPVLRTPWYEQLGFAVLRAANRALHWPLVLCGLAAMLLLALRPRLLQLTPGQRGVATLVAIVVAYAIALHMVVAPFPRYGIPFRPLLFALALLPLHAAWRYVRRNASPNLVA